MEDREWWEKQDLASLEAERKVKSSTEPFTESVELNFDEERGGARPEASRKASRAAKRTFNLSSRAIESIDETAGNEHIRKVPSSPALVADVIAQDSKGLHASRPALPGFQA